jgi:hypothetical protein
LNFSRRRDIPPAGSTSVGPACGRREAGRPPPAEKGPDEAKEAFPLVDGARGSRDHDGRCHGRQRKGPHTFTIVAKKDAPKTGLQVVNCRICNILGKAHGADPSGNAPPKFPFLENGVGQQTPPNVDKPGDSAVTGKGKKGEFVNLTVTAPAGTKLWMICLVHPWMQAEVDVT